MLENTNLFLFAIRKLQRFPNNQMQNDETRLRGAKQIFS